MSVSRYIFVLSLLIGIALALWLGMWAGEAPTGAESKIGDAVIAVEQEKGGGASGGRTVSADLAAGEAGPIAPSSSAADAEAAALSRNEVREKIDEWLSSSTETDVVVRHMVNGFGTLRPEDHILAARELVKLVGDAQYADLQRLQLDPFTGTEAKEWMFRNSLNRSDSVKLPLLLAIMKQPDHPCAAEAYELLALALGHDYGANFSQWHAAIEESLSGM